MIPRTLVPEKLNPIKPGDESQKTPRRLTTMLDERTVVPTGPSSAPPLDGKTNIPAHFPLGVLVTRSLIPRDMPILPLEDAQPLSEFAPIAILDSRVVVPAYVEPTTHEESQDFGRAPEWTAGLREMVEPDIYLTGEANLLVEPETKKSAKWDLITRIASVAVHIGLIIFLISVPKIFPEHVPTTQEIEQASKQLGITYLPPGDIPKTPAPPPVHINRNTLEKVAPPRPEEHAPVLPPVPAPSPAPATNLPESPTPRTQPNQPNPQPTQPPPTEEAPVRPALQPVPNHLKLNLPSGSPGEELQRQIEGAQRHGGGGVFSGGTIPRGAGAGSGPGMQSGAQILTDTQGVDFSSYIQRLLATLKRNWMAVMPESALMGDRGVVYTTFQINSDGSVPSPDPTLEYTSGKDPLDTAAISAIRASNPFEPLPPQFHGPYIRLRIVFIYNIPPDQVNLHK